uniref:Uncharacterized protein n=1 Tax=Oryza punctata TaxID=4537 RepID=A0A0E0L6U0_ORYPU
MEVRQKGVWAPYVSVSGGTRGQEKKPRCDVFFSTETHQFLLLVLVTANHLGELKLKLRLRL